ncbi:MAG: MarR family transcriptional regulator [Ilumatobacteraceae bacterium]
MDLLGRQLYRTYRAVRERLEESLSVAGISVPQWVVLKSVGDEPELSQRELADRVLVTGSTLTHHLDRLEREGLIERTRDADDRRVIRISLTEAGKHRRTELEAIVAAHEERLSGLLGERDATALRRLLARVEQRLSEG